MSLHYRGVTYNPGPESMETKESEIVGHYRGATWKLRQPKDNVEPHPPARLKYRGAWVR